MLLRFLLLSTFATFLALGQADAAETPCPLGLDTDSVSPCPFKDLRAAPPISPSQYTTKAGCECTSACSASPPTGRCDWCYTKNKCGQSGVTGYWDYCDYKPMKEFDSQSAEDKTNQLWEHMTAPDVVGKSGPVQSIIGIVKQILTESMITTFEDMYEVLPNGRTKVIHAQGAHCLFNMTVNPGSKYTGILETGESTGIIRMGSATSLDVTMFPGMGIKFLRSGVPSGDFVMLRSAGAGLSYNFFDSAFGNHVAPAQALVKTHKFQQASGCIAMVGLSDLCSYSQSGEKAHKPVFPFELIFEPTHKVNQTDAKKTDAQLLAELATIPVGSELFTVYTYDSPADLKAGIKTPLGTVTTTSPCYQSLFGDEKMFIRHQRMEEDFALRPDWIDQFKKLKLEDNTCTASAGPISKWQCAEEEMAASKQF